MKTFFGIEIPKRHSKCCKEQEDLQSGEEIFSVLRVVEERYHRQDYCSSCWQTIQGTLEESSILNWKSIVPKKEYHKQIYLNKDQKALSMLSQLAVSQILEEQHQAYMLSIYLWRKKQLVLKKEFKDDSQQTIILYEVGETEENILVKKFDFAEMNLPVIQKRIAASLK